MTTQYFCRSERRRALVRDTTDGSGNPLLNGIDYLEVSPDQRTLHVHFIHPLPGQPGGVPDGATALAPRNVVIEGGVRVTSIDVLSVAASDEVLDVTVSTPGDFSTYTLRISTSSTGSNPPEGFDPQLSEVQFSFKVDCPNDFDCGPDECPPEEPGPEPRIDYLARDFASLRQLMLDRLSAVIPDWRDRSSADLGMALVDTIAYVGDYLSYYQDAVSTEAYLGTARRRVSVRRHARILDYRLHEGCNSRAWIHVEAQGGGNVRLESGTPLLTRVQGYPAVVNDGSIDHEQIMAQVPSVFETMHDALLHQSHNEVYFYTWSDEECCLPQGATRATLRDDPASRLLLRPGDILIFEERKGVSATDLPDPSRRHTVRLTYAHPQASQATDGNRSPGPLVTDPLTGQAIVEVQWHHLDALPFPLQISTAEVEDITVAMGNVVLASHGQTLTEDVAIPEGDTATATLQEGPVTHSQAYDHESTRQLHASGLLEQDPRKALPEVVLDPDGSPWRPRSDLLSSGRSAREFVLEAQEDGSSHLRFGDGIMGRRPARGAVLQARYRVGNGRSGNVGADAIFHVVTNNTGVLGVRNPLAARGGIDPEPLEQVRLHAPQAFRVQQRAVTEEDYGMVAERHPEVQKAVASRRWTGSWHTMFLTVDRQGGLPVDAAFESELRRFIERFRLAGHDVEVEPPQFVPLDIEMHVCVLPGYYRGIVKEALLDTFSSVVLPDGRQGFFHPDSFTFGQPVYLSTLVAAAMEVPGVMWVDVTTFKRWGKPDQGERQEGRILMDRLEIAQMLNDPNAPESGRMEFHMEGGL